MKIKYIKYLLNIIIILFIKSNNVYAEADPTEIQLRMLPPYCQMRYTKDANLMKKWSKILGKDNVWMNHYCSALIHIMNCESVNYKERKACLKGSLSSYEYTLKHTSHNFILKPKIYYERGKIYSEMEELSLAEKDLRTSISLNPRNVSPYIELSKVYLKLKKPQESLDIINQGIKYSPNSKRLKNQLTKIKSN